MSMLHFAGPQLPIINGWPCGGSREKPLFANFVARTAIHWRKKKGRTMRYTKWITEDSRIYRRLKTSIDYRKYKATIRIYDPETGLQEVWFDVPISSWNAARRVAKNMRLDVAATLRGAQELGDHFWGIEWYDGRSRAIGG